MKIRAIFAAVTLLVCGAVSAQTHQYRLNGDLLDDMGGSALVSHGGTLGAAGYSFGANQGLTMNESLGGVYTIDMSFHFDTHAGWQKIIDFSNLASDAGMYTNVNQWYFYSDVNAGGSSVDLVDARLTLTRDAASLVTIYVDGTALASFNDAAANRANFGSNSANFFIDDLTTSQREAASGYVDYIRTYDSALDAGQVASLGVPLDPVPEPEAYLMLACGLGLIGLMGRRRRAP